MNDLPWRNPDYFGPTEEAEKKRLKQDVSRCSWILILLLILANVLAFVITFSLSFSVIFQDGGQSLAEAADLNAVASAFGMSPALFDFVIILSADSDCGNTGGCNAAPLGGLSSE